MALEAGPRHRRRCTRAARAPIGARRDRGRAPARGSSTSGTELLARHAPGRRRRSRPSRRSASPPTPTSSPSRSSSSTGRCPRPSSPGSSAPAIRGRARGPPIDGKRLKIWRARHVDERRRARAAIEVQPEGRRRMLELVEAQPGVAGRCRHAWLPVAVAEHGRRDAPRDEPRRARRVGADRRRRVRARACCPRCCARPTLDDRDRAFATDLVYGTVRAQRRARRPRSSRVVDAAGPAPRPAGARRAAAGCVPARAGCPRARGGRRDGRRRSWRARPRAAGFANGVLRARSRVSAAAVPGAGRATAVALVVPRLDRRASHRRARRRRRARAALGGDERAGGGHPAGRTRAAATRAASATELARAGGEVERGRARRGRRSWCGASVTRRRLPAVRDGRATPQDQGSQAVVAVLDPQPGERVADLAAAPGRQGHRDRRAGGRRRCGGRASTSTPAACASIDGARRPPRPAARGRRVVADGRDAARSRRSASTGCCSTRPAAASACSAVAPTRAGACNPTAIAELAALQRELLAAAAADGAPGRHARLLGVHAHPRRRPSTSTTWAAERLPDFARSTAARRPVDARTAGARCSCPQAAGTDGMFVLALQRDPRDAASPIAWPWDEAGAVDPVRRLRRAGAPRSTGSPRSPTSCTST